MNNRDREIDRAVELVVDFISAEADGHDDDDVISLEPRLRAMAEACGWQGEILEIELITAGEVRARTRRIKEELAKG
jgi:hypothetical protein